jgi:hypothetical protein
MPGKVTETRKMPKRKKVRQPFFQGKDRILKGPVLFLCEKIIYSEKNYIAT